MSDDILISVKEINNKQGSSLYIVYADGILAAASLKSDMDKFLESEDPLVTVHDDEAEEAILVHGLVLNPLELPFKVPEELMETRSIWLIQKMSEYVIDMDVYEHIEEVTEAVEKALKEDDVEIDDFAVVLAESMDFCLKVAKAGESLQISKVYGSA